MKQPEPPPSMSDLDKIREWGSSVADFLEKCGRTDDAEKVRAMVELASADDPDPEQLEAAVDEATLAMTVGVATAAAEQYRQLIEPTELALKEIEPGTEMYRQLANALEVYRVVVDHHDRVVELLRSDPPHVKARVDELTTQVEKRLRELGAALGEPG